MQIYIVSKMPKENKGYILDRVSDWAGKGQIGS